MRRRYVVTRHVGPDLIVYAASAEDALEAVWSRSDGVTAVNEEWLVSNPAHKQDPVTGTRKRPRR